MFGRTPKPAENSASSGDPYFADREQMIEGQLRRRGVVMHSVLEAMRAVPRHLFVSHELSRRAYDDEALPSFEGQTISQPYMVGVMTQELRPSAGQRILELGTGTGYQTAILAHLVGPTGAVYTIERFEKLASSARRRLEAMEIRNVHYFVGDGSEGWPATAEWERPEFERILVTAGTPKVPPPLLKQLVNEGILVVPLGDAESQMLTRVVRKGETFETTELFACRFVPLVGLHGWSQTPGS